MKQKLGLLILYYLRFFARLQLRKNKNCKIVGITGSAGKSSTRNAIYSVLKSKYQVKASFKANSESGIPLDILGLEMRDYSLLDWLRVLLLAPIKLLTYFEKFDYYLVEMGIDSPDAPKNMDFLLSIIRPNMAVFLNANLNHSFAFDHLITATNANERKKAITRAIATEKAKLVLSLPKTGFAFLNFDDQNIREICQGTKAEVYSFGSDNVCDLQIIDYQTSVDGQNISTDFTFQIQNRHSKGQQMKLKIKNFLLAKHYAYSLAPAIFIGLKAGVSAQEIKTTLENHLDLPLGRASVLAGKNNSLIIDSSYNASSMKDMLELVAKLPKTTGRKLALLGDLRELGEETKQVHEEIALLAGQSFAQIFLVGSEMRKYALPLIQKYNCNQAVHFANSKEAGQHIVKLLQKDDLILVKGSQNTIFLEEAIKEMMAEPKLADKLLCRQSPWWQSVKASR